MRTFIRALYNKSNEKAYHWAFIAGLSSFYFIILTYFGKSLNITTDQTSLTRSGFIISSVILGITFLSILFKAIGDKYDYRVKLNGMKVLSSIINKLNDSRTKKIEIYSSFLSDLDKQSICKYMAPLEQLSNVISQVRNAVHELIGVEESDIYVALLYRTNNDSPFSIITSKNAGILHRPQYSSNLDKLILHEVKMGRHQFISHIKNSDTRIFDWYKNNGIKTVYCGNITTDIGKNRVLEAYSIVGTAVFPICDENDRDTRTKFKTVIMNVFDLQFQVELLKKVIRDDDKCERRITPRRET